MTYQLGYKNDLVVDRMAKGWGNIRVPIEGTDKFGLVDKYGDMPYKDQIFKAHADTRFGGVWGDITNLRNTQVFEFGGSDTRSIPGVDNTGVVIPPSRGWINSGTTNFENVIDYSTPRF